MIQFYNESVDIQKIVKSIAQGCSTSGENKMPTDNLTHYPQAHLHQEPGSSSSKAELSHDLS